MEDSFILKTYQEQKEYNSKKSKFNQRCYYICSIATLVFSLTTIPAVASENIPKIISIISSLIVAIAQGCTNIFNFHDKWVYHRNITELLKSEYRKYSSKIKDYKNTEDKTTLFAEKLEDIISSGNAEWKELVKNNKSENK